ncbi:hypothetical protein [Streptacidiphilus melanogenes]|uniref:hypothetical protein n=1 Tax=Streptacidiphilus melanogenes TaxID=411235 RepID=UPI001269DD72|nr:hypothetical protein [Streptacidiphilus melanogenes]
MHAVPAHPLAHGAPAHPVPQHVFLQPVLVDPTGQDKDSGAWVPAIYQTMAAEIETTAFGIVATQGS